MGNIDDLGFFKEDYDRPDQKWVSDKKKKTKKKQKKGSQPGKTPSPEVEKFKFLRTIRATRGNWSRVILFATLVTLSVFFFSGYRDSIINPGDISLAHSYIDSDCGECHISAFSSVKEWASLVLKEKEIADEDNLCLACHIMGFDVSSPHSLSPETLKKLRMSKTGLHPASSTENNERENKLTLCPDCHIEHKGVNHNLSNFEDVKCKACHQDSAKGMSNHEFKEQPASAANKQIKMTHVNHFSKHFKLKKYGDSAPKDCMECHEPIPGLDSIPTPGYSETCMKCHEEEIFGALLDGPKGIPVFTVPGIDIETINKRNFSIGTWPKKSKEKLSPFMKLLLSVDPQNSKNLETVANLNLRKLQGASDLELQAVIKLSQEIKSFFQEISSKGHLALAARIQKATDRKMNNQELAMLSELLPMYLFDQSTQKWFGPDGIKNTLNEAARKPQKISNENWVSKGGWYIDNFTIYYRPAGHNDRFIYGWINLVTSMDLGNPSKPVAEIFTLLSNPKSPGACFKCHPITENSPGSYKVHWKNKEPNNKKLKFFVFSHSPHQTVAFEKGCSFCHEMSMPPENKSLKVKSDRRDVTKDFRSIQMSLCVGCHLKRGSGENCLNCHVYHVKSVNSGL